MSGLGFSVVTVIRIGSWQRVPGNLIVRVTGEQNSYASSTGIFAPACGPWFCIGDCIFLIGPISHSLSGPSICSATDSHAMGRCVTPVLSYAIRSQQAQRIGTQMATPEHEQIDGFEWVELTLGVSHELAQVSAAIAALNDLAEAAGETVDETDFRVEIRGLILRNPLDFLMYIPMSTAGILLLQVIILIRDWTPKQRRGIAEAERVDLENQKLRAEIRRDEIENDEALSRAKLREAIANELRGGRSPSAIPKMLKAVDALTASARMEQMNLQHPELEQQTRRRAELEELRETLRREEELRPTGPEGGLGIG